MSKRTTAKEAVIHCLSKDRVRTKNDLNAHPYKEELLRGVHTMLEELGYTHHGTRGCIINEAFRERGLAPFRDSRRMKVYRFEDYTLWPSLGQEIIRPLSEELLRKALGRLCLALGLDRTPELIVRDGSYSIASHRQATIILASSMCNLGTLIHELSHIVCGYTGWGKGHDSGFMAVQIGILAGLSLGDMNAMLELCKSHRIPVKVGLCQDTEFLIRSELGSLEI